MTKEQKAFIEKLAGYVCKYAPQYGIKVHSPIIAQGILESGWGKIKLASVYFNYFGLKCGSKWMGKSVNMTTQEEYTPGTKTTIKDNFRVYDSMEEGVRGYFEFIQLDRYKNLKGITDPLKYLQTIRDDGYATASDYAADVYKVVVAYGLTAYDNKPAATPKTRSITEKDIIIYGHGSGTPRKTDLYSYASERYAKKAPNGKPKGTVMVRRFKALTDAGRVSFEARFRTILGRNHYSQNLRGYVYTAYKDGKHYSDCSSIGMATLKVIGYSVGSYLLNTAGIYYSDLFETVPVKIVNGHITNPELLKVGDVILMGGNDSSRPLQIGHAEWVAIVPAQTEPVKEESKPEKKGYTGGFPVLPSRGYFKTGDKSAEVKKVQKLVNWINGGKIAVDGYYGSQTATAVKKAQKAIGVTADGLFGKNTLKAAKAYKK